MKIDVLANDGSPLGVTMKTIWGDAWRVGTGGSEMAILTLCEQWAKEGHDVCFYNDPKEHGVSPFDQQPIDKFDPQADRSVLITFRSPNPKALISKGLKVWLSFDQFTMPHLRFQDFAPHMDKIVCISDYHAKYFADKYRIHNTIVIDLPVRYQDFDELGDVEKVPNRAIFTSVPDRGLDFLWYMWPEIKRDIPDIELHITSDYRLWGNNNPNNQRHRLKWMQHEGGVKFLGAIPRVQLLKEQAEAQFLLYPSLYDTAELFCVSVAEAQAMGVLPITSSWGALETTNMGTVIPGKANEEAFKRQFMDELKYLCANPHTLAKEVQYITDAARDRFHPEIISKQWSEKVFA